MAISKNENYAEAYYNRGIAMHKMEKLAEAISDFNRAIRLNPDYADAYYSRGSAKRDIGQYFQAISDFNREIIRLNPRLCRSLL